MQEAHLGKRRIPKLAQLVAAFCLSFCPANARRLFQIIQRPVTLLAANTLTVELRNAASGFALQYIGVDAAPTTITASSRPADAAGWYNVDVAGNSATFTPAAGTNFISSDVTATGTVTDALSSIAGVTRNGAAAAITGSIQQ